jgi:hypothetical protein
MHINSCIFALREAVDALNRQNELVKWQIGVHRKTEVTNFPLFRYPQQLFLHSALIAILADIPYLELSVSDMRCQMRHIFSLWELYVEHLRADLCDFVLSQDLFLELVVVFGEILLEGLHCFVLFQLAQHAHERS